jgi:hypothetical protein
MQIKIAALLLIIDHNNKIVAFLNKEIENHQKQNWAKTIF